MLLLITKYNLTPKWIQLLTFFIFYLICIKLHYLDNDVVDCMRRVGNVEERINNQQNTLELQGAPERADWVQNFLQEGDPISRPYIIADRHHNVTLHGHLAERLAYVRQQIGYSAENPSENRALTALMQGLHILDQLNLNHNHQLDNLEAGFGNLETNLQQVNVRLDNTINHVQELNERLHNIDTGLSILNNQLNPPAPVPVPPEPTPTWEQLIGQCVIGAGKGVCKLATNPETYKTAGIATALILSIINISS